MLSATTQPAGSALPYITSILAFIVILVVLALLVTGKVSVFRFSLKEWTLEIVGAGPGAALNAAIDAITAPLSAVNYTSYAASIVDACLVNARLDTFHVDVARQNWLTSRLFIMVSLLERMRGLRAVVFVEAGEGGGSRFVGFAHPAEVRWSLARRYPWLEEAYAKAYAAFAQGDQNLYRPTDSRGALTPPAIFKILQFYLDALQKTQEFQPASHEWTPLGQDPPTWEHATWLRRADLEDVLGEVLKRPTVSAALPRNDKIRAVLRQSGDFVAAVDGENVKTMIDRRKWTEEAARIIAQQ